MNKIQITGGENSSDKIEEKRGNISQMINLRFGARALPFKSQNLKESGMYLPSPNYILTFRHSQILNGGTRPGYEYFNGGSSEIPKDFLNPDFYLKIFSLLLSFI